MSKHEQIGQHDQNEVEIVKKSLNDQNESS